MNSVLAVMINGILGLWLILMVYFPGTNQTVWLFQIILPFWGGLSSACLMLNSPVKFLVKFIPATALIHLQGWFPEVSAAKFAAFLTHKPLVHCLLMFPGKIEWLTLLSILFWDLLLLAIYQGYGYMTENLDVHAAVQVSKAILMEHQINRQIEKKLRPGKSHGVPGREDSKDSPHRDQEGEKQHHQTLDRLSKTRNQPATSSTPPIIVKPNMQDWENYKQEQGDLMVRDMVRQLQRENASLHAQQDKLRSTISQYFSPKVLSYLEANRGNFQSVNNEKHQISVLFCDIRGFSNYSLSASSDEIVNFLGEYFEIASHFILNKHDGVVSKLMGDGLMAYWGFPVPNADHAYIATRAALDILHEVDLRNHIKSSQTPLNIGIAIATGEVVVGNVGSTDFKDFTLIGSSVNMAARLEETNKTLGTRLLISDETYKALKGRISCQDYGQIQIRGWQSTEHVYGPHIPKLSS